MSTTDDSFSVTHDPIEIQRPSLKERWWHIMDTWKIGIIPLPLFVLAGALIAIDCLGGKLPRDIVVMVATLAFFGFACGGSATVSGWVLRFASRSRFLRISSGIAPVSNAAF